MLDNVAQMPIFTDDNIFKSKKKNTNFRITHVLDSDLTREVKVQEGGMWSAGECSKLCS